MSAFSINLKFLRTSKKLSQEGLAGMIGLNRGNIASYEKGTAEPSLSNLLRIARFFGVDPFELVEGALDKSNDILVTLSDQAYEPVAGGPESNEIKSQIQRQLSLNRDDLVQFRKKSDEMRKILEGFRQFHKYKMESGGEVSEDVKRMALDYERLMEVLDEVLKSNIRLMELFEP